MKKILQLIVLFLLPLVTYLVIDWKTGHNLEQVALICSYIVFITVLIFTNMEMYIFITELKAYWNTESVKEIEIHLSESSYANNVLKIKPYTICLAKPVDTLSKVRLYTTDSYVFVKSLRDNFIWIVLVNGVVLFATYYFSENTVGTPIIGNHLATSLADLIKKSLGFLAVILQVVFFISQLILHRNRNNRLYAELTALK